MGHRQTDPRGPRVWLGSQQVFVNAPGFGVLSSLLQQCAEKGVVFSVRGGHRPVVLQHDDGGVFVPSIQQHPRIEFRQCSGLFRQDQALL